MRCTARFQEANGDWTAIYRHETDRTLFAAASGKAAGMLGMIKVWRTAGGGTWSISSASAWAIAAGSVVGQFGAESGYLQQLAEAAILR